MLLHAFNFHAMKLFLQSKASSADLLILSFFKGESLDKRMQDLLGKASKMVDARFIAKDFEGEEGQVLTLFPEGASFKRIVLMGRGEKSEQMPQATEHLGARMTVAVKAAKAKKVLILTQAEELYELASGFVLGHYEFTMYRKKDPKKVELEAVHFLCETTAETKQILEKVAAFHQSATLTRTLINTCAGNQNTDDLVDSARALAKTSKLKMTVLDDKKLKKLGCGAIFSVGQGALTGARMVFLEYRFKSKSKQPDYAFIGKGITFDSGGMNLKPSGHIEDMKLDMSGASTVLGLMQALAQLKTPGYFLGVLCVAENAVSDRAVHPGDVVTAYNGKTIEITNTDAEGRMVLADGLAYTEKNYKPKKMLTIATLTGAVTVALGYNITGVMANDEPFMQDLLAAGKKAKERFWPLPMDEDFVKATKGDFSDLKNATDGVRAGTIMGAAFLKNFVEKTPWVHLDIAGTSWAERPTPTTKYGATAASLRTLIELAQA